MKPEVLIQEFDYHLEKEGLSFRGVVIGATALALLRIVSRETQDCDVLDPQIPDAIKNASKSFAAEKGKTGLPLKEDWLNNGPESLKQQLPEGWLKRCVPLFSGKALTLLSLAREDLLKTKLYAFCDRQQDLEDCIALKPTKAELSDSIDWVKKQDANPDWPSHVERSLVKLAKRLGHGV